MYGGPGKPLTPAEQAYLAAFDAFLAAPLDPKTHHERDRCLAAMFAARNVRRSKQGPMFVYRAA